MTARAIIYACTLASPSETVLFSFQVQRRLPPASVTTHCPLYAMHRRT
ncbi:hypothetical protein [Thermosporothrix hazakensis]|nr:hypothetical protein [Thermosporothrix hazakensis]